MDRSGARLHELLARLTFCREGTEELTQELFLRLCQSKGFERASDPAAYAGRVAINLAMDWRRTKKRQIQPLLPEDETVEDYPSALEKMVCREEIEEVLNAIARLNRLAREVVVLRYIEQESYEQISERLGKKPQYLRSVCSKALLQLRNLLNREMVSLIQEEKSNE